MFPERKKNSLQFKTSTNQLIKTELLWGCWSVKSIQVHQFMCALTDSRYLKAWAYLVTDSLVFLEMMKAIISGLTETKMLGVGTHRSYEPLPASHVLLVSTDQQIRSCSTMWPYNTTVKINNQAKAAAGSKQLVKFTGNVSEKKSENFVSDSSGDA